MIGYRETDTLGNKIFVATSCEFCQMDTAGNHDYGCPNRKNRIGYEGIEPVDAEVWADLSDVPRIDVDWSYFTIVGDVEWEGEKDVRSV